ncbi:SusC/RagA family TonB-linked outer membrane protein [Dyadobacter psychrotolerans]|uniref:TonB-dependent receptor n=1 Tax=Dyadobacter psychrotolerans TaxID=2541721 RepID=A0A4R5DMX1_9BACT|nr:TonB-dependent receptor [Dyadobacter psychrotolerans]TDE14877.1 TonB-dependent receptor [Dyadobacter psychrotolerans]
MNRKLLLLLGVLHLGIWPENAQAHRLARNNATVQFRADQTVSGRVTAENGDVLPGVTVMMKATTTGTTTDIEGNYKISVTGPSAILVFSYVGYATREITVGNSSVADVKLSTDDKNLNEVIVVGYGNQERRDVTGAVSMVKSQNIKDLPLTSADQKLSGQVAGVQVSQVTGTPGGGVVVRVRGSGSLGAGDDPLYVIDGFPVTNSFDKSTNPLSALNPDDIESITVLKDASSTAIYGSRGANGVILISTKQAKAGTSKIEFNAYGGFQIAPQRSKIKMMNAEQFANFRTDYRQDLAKFEGRTFDPASIPADYQNPSALGAGTDWYDVLTKTAAQQNYNLTFSKGTDNLRSVLSAGYFNQDGVIRNTGFERYSLRLNVDGSPMKNVRIGLNLNPSFVNRKIANTEGQSNTSLLTQGLLNSPVAAVYNADGTYNQRVTSTDAFVNANPLSTLLDTKNSSATARVLTNTYLEVTPLPGLTLKTTFNVDYTSARFDLFKASTVGTFRNPPPQPATGSVINNSMINWLNENTLTYNRTFGKHRFDALLGYTVQKEVYRQNATYGASYPSDAVETINAATAVTAGADYQEWRLLSYLARINYSLADRYLLSVAIRRDGSSRFGVDNRWANFPSVSGAWRVSEEHFFPKTPWVEEVKIRASYGLSGNNNIGNYAYIPRIGTDNYNFGGTLASGFLLSSLANSQLGWESSRQTDLGLDVALLKGRLYVSAEFYNRHTEDMLQTLDIPASSGFSSAITNVGNVRNRGFELSVNSKNAVSGKFKWDTDFNISFNRNKVLDIGGKTQILSGELSSNITKVGQPMGMFYGFDFQGIVQNQTELDAIPKYAGQVVGSVKYRDVNEDGKIDVNDRTTIGSPYPKFTWGMTNRFSYGKLDMSVLITGVQGSQIFDVYKRFTTNIDGVFNVEEAVKDRWRSPEQPGNGEIPTTNASTSWSRELNSLWVKNASFVSVRNITLGYTIKTPSKFSARVYASGQNMFLFSPYKGGWPELSYQGNSSLAPGINYTGYPVPVSYILGVNFQF